MAGRIVAEDLEELRQRADIVEIIGGFTQLKKAGRIFKGLCCFHQEKTPSLSVDPDKRFFHCFGCDAGGDVFTFVKQMEGLSFTESAERLAARYGVTLRYEGGTREGGSRRALIEAVAAAAEFYVRRLMSEPEAEGARKYLESRGFTSEDAKRWRLGYSPAAWDGLYRHLLSRKFSAAQIEAAGLVRASESGQYRDQFRGRLMFPIAEVSGEVIGFGARALGAEQPKYLNSPETPIYHKARVLYGLDQSRRGIAKDGVAVVTEGYTDVIGLHKAGVETAVATCGTALGDDHLGLLKRFCDRAILAFDADAAGAVASERAFGQHHELGLEVLVAPLPAGKDPADVALTEGAEAVEAILEAAVPLMRFVLEAEIARHRVDTPEGKGRAVRAAAQLLSWEPSRVARGEHAFWVARKIGVEESSVQREISEAAAPAPRREAPATSRQPGHVKVEREALALVLNEPGIVAASDLTEEHFTLQENRSILQAIREANGADAAAIMDRLPDDTTRRLAAELALTTPVTQDPQEVFVRLEEFRLRRKISDLRTTLERLDPSSGDYRERFEELIRIEDLRRQLEIR